MGSIAPDETTDTNHPQSLDLEAGRTPAKNLTHRERDSMRTVLKYISIATSETHDRHDRSSESPLCTLNNSPPNTRRPWDDVSDTPQYDKVIHWEDDLAAGSRSISPTNIATVSEETEILIKDNCTFSWKMPTA